MSLYRFFSLSGWIVDSSAVKVLSIRGTVAIAK